MLNSPILWALNELCNVNPVGILITDHLTKFGDRGSPHTLSHNYRAMCNIYMSLVLLSLSYTSYALTHLKHSHTPNVSCAIFVWIIFMCVSIQQIMLLISMTYTSSSIFLCVVLLHFLGIDIVLHEHVAYISSMCYVTVADSAFS